MTQAMKQPKKKKITDNKEHCKNCGIHWHQHDGVEPTCAKLLKACLAIKLIQNLALTDIRQPPTADDPAALQPKMVAEFCERMNQGLLSTFPDA